MTAGFAAVRAAAGVPVAAVLVRKALDAAQDQGIEDILIGGGVAANSRLRAMAAGLAAASATPARTAPAATRRNTRISCPPRHQPDDSKRNPVIAQAVFTTFGARPVASVDRGAWLNRS